MTGTRKGDRRGARAGADVWGALGALPRGARAALFALLGAAAGAALVVARIANATSYLSDASDTCINCHVMTTAYATHERGSHGKVAVCNDCHVPRSNPVAGWAFKARDGLWHSYVFTARREPQVMRLSAGAVPVVQANCVRCHADQVAMVRLAGPGERRCWDCHQEAHGPVRSLSATPAARRPGLPPAGLHW